MRGRDANAATPAERSARVSGVAQTSVAKMQRTQRCNAPLARLARGACSARRCGRAARDCKLLARVQLRELSSDVAARRARRRRLRRKRRGRISARACGTLRHVARATWLQCRHRIVTRFCAAPPAARLPLHDRTLMLRRSGAWRAQPLNPLRKRRRGPRRAYTCRRAAAQRRKSRTSSAAGQRGVSRAHSRATCAQRTRLRQRLAAPCGRNRAAARSHVGAYGRRGPGERHGCRVQVCALFSRRGRRVGATRGLLRGSKSWPAHVHLHARTGARHVTTLGCFERGGILAKQLRARATQSYSYAKSTRGSNSLQWRLEARRRRSDVVHNAPGAVCLQLEDVRARQPGSAE